MKTLRGKIYIALGVIFVLAVAGLYAYLYVIPEITGALRPTSVVVYGNLKTAEVLRCFFSRDEKVYLSADSGEVSYYAAEGEKNRIRSKVLDIFPPGGSPKPYLCEKTGVISYYIDGYEEYFAPGNLLNINPADLSEAMIVVADVRKDYAEKGDPLYKLVSDSVWYAVTFLPDDGVAGYESGDTITLNLPDADVEGRVDIVEPSPAEGVSTVIFRFTSYYEHFSRLRQTDVSVISKDYEGLILPAGSVTTEKGRKGVYVKTIGGEFNFIPIKIITQTDSHCLVADTFFYEQDASGNSNKVNTVKIYDEILKNPEK